jgi:hypothetical protein
MSKEKVEAKKVTVYGKHNFNEEEKRQVAADLAEKVQESKRIEDEMVSMKSSFKSKLDVTEALINKLSVDYACGYEMRMLPCSVEFDTKKKEKKFYEAETGALIKTEPMTEEDLQKELFGAE